MYLLINFILNELDFTLLFKFSVYNDFKINFNRSGVLINKEIRINFNQGSTKIEIFGKWNGNIYLILLLICTRYHRFYMIEFYWFQL